VLPQKWAKIHQNCLRLTTPSILASCQISSTSVKPPWRIALQKFVYTLQYFGSPGGLPGPKVTVLGSGVHQPHSSYWQNFVQFRRLLANISATKLRRFCCDPQKSASVMDWCMPPHGITGPQNQCSPNAGKKCALAGHLTMQNFVAIRQEMSEISVIGNLCCQKKCTKVHQNLPTFKAPIMPNFIEIGATTLEKSVTFFLHPSISWLFRETPGSKVTSLDGGVHRTSTPPASYQQNFLVQRTPLRDICCQTSSILLWCDPHRVNDMSPQHVTTVYPLMLTTTDQKLQKLYQYISDGLMRVAVWHRRTPKSKFSKFGQEVSIGHPLSMQNLVAIQQEVSEISAIENLCSPKSGPKFTKIA